MSWATIAAKPPGKDSVVVTPKATQAPIPQQPKNTQPKPILRSFKYGTVVETPIQPAAGPLSKNAKRKLKKLQAQEPKPTPVEVKKEQKEVEYLKLRGMINSGNLCFMNSIIQIIFSTPPFYTLFKYLSKHSMPRPSPLTESL